MKRTKKILHIEELPDKIPDKMIGMVVDTYAGLGRIAKMKNGINRPRVFFKCSKCRGGDYFFLLNAAFGAGGYATKNFDTERYDLRDKIYEYCAKHRKRN